MWFIGVEVEQETSAPPPKKNPGSAPGSTANYLHSIASLFSLECCSSWSDVLLLRSVNIILSNVSKML